MILSFKIFEKFKDKNGHILEFKNILKLQGLIFYNIKNWKKLHYWNCTLNVIVDWKMMKKFFQLFYFIIPIKINTVINFTMEKMMKEIHEIEDNPFKPL